MALSKEASLYAVGVKMTGERSYSQIEEEKIQIEEEKGLI